MIARAVAALLFLVGAQVISFVHTQTGTLGVKPCEKDSMMRNYRIIQRRGVYGASRNNWRHHFFDGVGFYYRKINIVKDTSVISVRWNDVEIIVEKMFFGIIALPGSIEKDVSTVYNIDFHKEVVGRGFSDVLDRQYNVCVGVFDLCRCFARRIAARIGNPRSLVKSDDVSLPSGVSRQRPSQISQKASGYSSYQPINTIEESDYSARPRKNLFKKAFTSSWCVSVSFP